MLRRLPVWYRLRNNRLMAKPFPARPAHKERGEEKSLDAQLKRYSILSPVDVLSRGEAREVRRLFKIDEGDAFDSESKRAACRRLAELAQAVLGRYIGLERFMVIDVERDNGKRTKLLLKEFDILNRNGWNPDWTWMLSGRALRKNGTIGYSSSSIGFRDARVHRRTLAGEWKRLSPIRRLGWKHAPPPR